MGASIRVLIAIPLALALPTACVAGCGGGGDPTSGDEPGGGPIVLGHRGGYPPSKGTITIDADGGGRIVGMSFEGKPIDTAFTVPPDELAQLRDRLDELDLATLDVPEPPRCCDIVYYELSHDGATVETSTGSGPVELADAIDEINDLAPDDGGGGGPD